MGVPERRIQKFYFSNPESVIFQVNHKHQHQILLFKKKIE